MRAGDIEVAFHVREIQVLDAKAVHAIDHVQDAVLVVTVAVVFFDQITDSANRQFHTAAGLHPGHAQHAGLRLNAAGDGTNDFVCRNSGRVFEQANLAHLRAFALLTEF